MRSYKSLYKAAIEAEPGRLHFAAHSHHPWPDATREAHLQFWDDSAQFLDEKWEKKLLTEILPEARRHLTNHLRFKRPADIALAPNTHELAYRVLSTFPTNRPIRILTTNSEFHSFGRQVARLEEASSAKVVRVATEPFDTFPARFIEQARTGAFDLVFVSHVFFNSGYAFLELEQLSAETAESSVVVIDGYHAFGAIPVDLSRVGERCFYLGGGYKYIQAGEGACFLTLPPSAHELRPRNTGWFAGLSSLSKPQGTEVPYPADGFRFAGSTFDPSAWYRFNAVMRLWEYEGIDVEAIHARVATLEKRFIESQPLQGRVRTGRELERQGGFIAFDLMNAPQLHASLMEKRVITDFRGSRLRFGFGIYHDVADVDRLTAILSADSTD